MPEVQESILEQAKVKVVARFWTKVKKTESCWLWLGDKSKRRFGSYGRIGYGKRGKSMYAHRLSYELHHGTIPPHLQIDHICRNTLCVNPFHLEAVTARVNLQRSFDARQANGTYINAMSLKTHCPQGHPYDLFNTLVNNLGRRQCRECNRRRCLSAYYAKKERIR